MYGIFRKKSKSEKLQDRYRKLMEEAHKLSHVNRKQADQKIAEAEEVMKQLEKIS